jgi:hypothetical protein
MQKKINALVLQTLQDPKQIGQQVQWFYPQLIGGQASAVPASRGRDTSTDRLRSRDAISAPLLWLSLRDLRLAVGSRLALSIPVFRSVQDWAEREECSTVPLSG